MIIQGKLIIPIVSLSLKTDLWPIRIVDQSGKTFAFSIDKERMSELISDQENFESSGNQALVRACYKRTFWGSIKDLRIEIIEPGYIARPK